MRDDRNTGAAMLKKLILSVLCAAGCLSSAAGTEITVLQSTDLHGSPAIAKFAKWIAEERKADPDLLLIDCGDLTNGTFATSCDGGASMVECLNLCKYDVWVPGNHEFRIGNRNFRRAMELFRSGDVLAANLKFDDPRKKPARPVLPWKLFERKGVKIAVIGMASHRYDNWVGFALYNGIRLISPADTLREIMPEVRRAKPDIIIVAAHSDVGQPVETVTGNDKWIPAKDVYAQYPDITLFLAGHTHRLVPLNEFAPGQWTVQPKDNGASMAKIRLEFDPAARKVIKITAGIVESKNLQPLPDSEMPEAWRRNNQAALLAAKTPVAQIPAEMVWNAKTKQGGIPPELIPEIIRQAAGADAAILGNILRLRPTSAGLTERFFQGIRNTGITVLTLTPEQLGTVLAEQGDIRGRSAGLDPAKLPEKNLRIAFDDYDVTGCDGKRMKLRAIALSGVPQEHLDLTVRSGVRDYFLGKYPAEKAPEK